MLIDFQNSTASAKMKAHKDASRYAVKIAETNDEVNSALRLRYEVFNVELAHQVEGNRIEKLEYDEFDTKCKHLIVIEGSTGKTVGTYRLNSLETAKSASGFYAFTEFSIEELPKDVLAESIEIGRACIAREHRNARVLFILWKALADIMKASKKRYLFGCCSIFTTDPEIGKRTFWQLEHGGFLHDYLRVEAREHKICCNERPLEPIEPVELPNLFEIYMKIGAKVCSEPTIDFSFGTIDYFVIFDREMLNSKYRKMFFGD